MMGASVIIPSVTIEATIAEEAEVEDAGTVVTIIRSGATGLVKTVGRTRLARAPGGISLASTAPRVMQAFLRCQEGMTTIATS